MTRRSLEGMVQNVLAMTKRIRSKSNRKGSIDLYRVHDANSR